MKKIIVALTLVLFSLNLYSAEIKWEKDFFSAIKKAKKENKPIMFVISRHSCKYCTILADTTFKDKKFVDTINKDFVAVKAYAEAGSKDYIPAYLYVNSTPTTWFLYKNGLSLYPNSVAGAIPTKDFVDILELVKARYKEVTKEGKYDDICNCK